VTDFLSESVLFSRLGRALKDTGAPKVGVVLVNWNGAKLTIQCIASLYKCLIRPYRIVVVDNASTDNSAVVIAEHHPEVEMIRNSDNRGFAGGNNIGIQKLIQDDVDYLWILNNDTEVDAGCIEAFVDFMERNPDAAACCGKILYHIPRDRIWYAGATFNRLLFQTKHRGALQKDVGQFERVEETPFITGCSIFVRKHVWERVGLFDERFFAYSEDFDWCLRAKKEGFRLYYVPDAIIYHKVSSSFKLKEEDVKGFTTPLMIELVHRNRIYILRKYVKSKIHLFLLYSLLLAKATAYSMVLICLGRFNKSRAVWKGILAGLACY